MSYEFDLKPRVYSEDEVKELTVIEEQVKKLIPSKKLHNDTWITHITMMVFDYKRNS